MVRKKGEKTMKVKFKNIIPDIFSICLLILFLFISFDFLCYPEKYITSWKYQLKNDILNGNEEMIEYYETRYLKNNIELF